MTFFQYAHLADDDVDVIHINIAMVFPGTNEIGALDDALSVVVFFLSGPLLGIGFFVQAAQVFPENYTFSNMQCEVRMERPVSDLCLLGIFVGNMVQIQVVGDQDFRFGAHIITAQCALIIGERAYQIRLAIPGASPGGYSAQHGVLTRNPCIDVRRTHARGPCE